MAIDIGINFRLTSGYVTDGANETYCLASDTYPTTRGGVTFGWDTAVNAADRDSAGDRRLAGICWAQTAQKTFRLDLPATGATDIRAAFGDALAQQYVEWLIKDNATTIGTISGQSGGADQYKDATNVNRTSESDWINNNAVLTHTFTSTTLYVVSNNNAVADVITHLRVVQADTGNRRRRALIGRA